MKRFPQIMYRKVNYKILFAAKPITPKVSKAKSKKNKHSFIGLSLFPLWHIASNWVNSTVQVLIYFLKKLYDNDLVSPKTMATEVKLKDFIGLFRASKQDLKAMIIQLEPSEKAELETISKNLSDLLNSSQNSKRVAHVERMTAETKITVDLNLDGDGTKVEVSTGIGELIQTSLF